MKYLMIDTNIYIDMIVSRNGDHKPESYNQLMKLLDYGQIRLIVPKIVITEIFRHLDKEIDKIGQFIMKMKSEAKSLYWINQLEELERFGNNLKPVKKGINDLADEFNSNKEKYKAEYKELFNKLFKHSCSIIVEENENIIFKATQRKVHKKRPFHYSKKDDDKDCMADSIIIETLINIEELMKFNIEDEIYFISRNPTDFSDDQNTSIIHSDIKTSLDLKGISGRVHYRLMFTKTLLHDFKTEIENVGLIEQLESELEYERLTSIEEDYAFYNDNERESAGLTSLSSNYLEIVSELSEITELLQYLEKMKNKIRTKCEEYSESYYSLDEEIENKSLKELQEIISSNCLLASIIGEYEDGDDIKTGIRNLVNWMAGNNDELNLTETFYNTDYFELNDTLATFYDIDNNCYRLDTSGYLNPSDDSEDTIYIRLYRGDALIQKDQINVYYGYMTFNDDGNAGNGAQESIEVNLEKTISELTNIRDTIINNIDERIIKISELTAILNI